MKSTVRYAALIVLLMFSVACDGSLPGGPSLTPPPPPPAPAPAPTNLPPLSGPSRTFVFHSELSYPVREFTKQSRFVLYDNGAFLLVYEDFSLRGEYTDTNGVIAFYQVDGGVATGRLSNGELTVNFNDEMEQADFEDAIYVLTP